MIVKCFITLVGILIAVYSFIKIFSIGTIRIDTSDGSVNPYLLLELSKDVSTLFKRKIAVVKISNKSLVPHK